MHDVAGRARRKIYHLHVLSALTMRAGHSSQAQKSSLGSWTVLAPVDKSAEAVSTSADSGQSVLWSAEVNRCGTFCSAPAVGRRVHSARSRRATSRSAGEHSAPSATDCGINLLLRFHDSCVCNMPFVCRRDCAPPPAPKRKTLSTGCAK
jgi:hypothetical protein